MNFWVFRVDPLGSPFRNVNSGVSDYNDHINETRLRKRTRNYLISYESKKILKKKKNMILHIWIGIPINIAFSMLLYSHVLLMAFRELIQDHLASILEN